MYQENIFKKFSRKMYLKYKRQTFILNAIDGVFKEFLQLQTTSGNEF